MANLTRSQFFAAIAPAVLFVREEGSRMFPSLRMAQSLLESGGQLHPWNNLGGIKVGGGKTNAYWQGEAVVKGTWEFIDGKTITARAAFRAYKSIYHFYKDLDLLLATPRYERVRAAGTAERQAEMLYACGYATDPAYPAKLISLMKQYKLQAYDMTRYAPAPPTRNLQDASRVAVVHQGQLIGPGYLLNGTTWIPARLIGEALGAKIGWTGTQATVNGIERETLLSDSTGYIKVRDLAEVLDVKVQWDGLARAVLLGQ
jgi:flagellar protein FlgJ